ncbi:MAG: hypothetical protein KatS3mg131_2277 [Candidatus Tectimicrobiota bacterium]|nr:MAG: hypothetical protein KatS3mg131_2277 [Candidatus Tectomicrobia bacterium]
MITAVLLCLLGVLVVSPATALTDRERDGFRGPVRFVRVEKAGTPQQSRRQHATSPTPLTPVLWQTLAYNSQGNRTEAAFYSDDGTSRWRWQYTYDAQGRRQERRSYDDDGTLRWRWRYAYDAQGRLHRQHEYNGDGELVRWWQYTYDAQGRMVEGNSPRRRRRSAVALALHLRRSGASARPRPNTPPTASCCGSGTTLTTPRAACTKKPSTAPAACGCG